MKRKSNIGFLVLRLKNAAADKKLCEPSSNGRKVLVSKIYPDEEKSASERVWKSTVVPEKTPVVETGIGGLEVSTFSEKAKQTRHKHLRATECYTVLKGAMTIRLDNSPPVVLHAGDEIIVFPLTIHEIVRKRKFLTRVHSVNTHGKDDKYVERNGRWKKGPWSATVSKTR